MKFRDWLQTEETQDLDELDMLKKPEGMPTKAWWRYGNYCGPGPKLRPKTCDALASGRPLPEPINAVDAVCKQHDIEYCNCGATWKSGLWLGQPTSCSLNSDRSLVKKLDAITGGPISQRLAAKAISSYFKMHLGLQGRKRETDSGTVGGISSGSGKPLGDESMAR